MQAPSRSGIARKQASCQKTCPAGVDVPRYVGAIAAGKFDQALAVIRESIPFPSVCGYACFAPCESACAKGQFDAPLAIRALKRAAAEQGGEGWKSRISKGRPSGKKVAVIGSGPSGLTAAYHLALKGHSVTVFEAGAEAGGMMRRAIPEYRLPRNVLEAEIEEVRGAGVEIKTGARVQSAGQLAKSGYQAVFVACGAEKSATLGIPGDGLEGVTGALEFLTEVNSGKPPAIGKRVAVIGGGNAAIDAARSAIRLGAASVVMFYRRTRDQMPASDDEIEAALEEGLKIEFLAAPARIEKQDGALKVTFDCMELGPPDRSGRPRPVPKAGFDFALIFDTVISAVSQKVDLAAGFGIACTQDGLISVDESLATDVKGTFAGGDAVRGPASIIEAIAHGKLAASSIDRFLGGDGVIRQTLASDPPAPPSGAPDEETARASLPQLARGIRTGNFEVVEGSLNPITARREANRCLRCDYREFNVALDPAGCKECGYCLNVCAMGVFGRGSGYNAKGYRPLEVKSSTDCVGCMKCFYNCPDFCIEIKGAA